jgi:hypothetical protein
MAITMLIFGNVHDTSGQKRGRLVFQLSVALSIRSSGRDSIAPLFLHRYPKYSLPKYEVGAPGIVCSRISRSIFLRLALRSDLNKYRTRAAIISATFYPSRLALSYPNFNPVYLIKRSDD